jgi:hypothetical protein
LVILCNRETSKPPTHETRQTQAITKGGRPC